MEIDEIDFDVALEYLVEQMSAATLLAIPGVYEVLREELNNEVIAHIDADREED